MDPPETLLTAIAETRALLTVQGPWDIVNQVVSVTIFKPGLLHKSDYLVCSHEVVLF